ncbi:MAG: fused MFS/spermidine synthase [Alphaproteobacteria bacterium]|nr:fused MFS/spermidine synthase [Alphaproteobacteria bacterium]MBL6936963.1 fused MFS/spermidine synthase [Alphaproteobacteria bacterium]MBL7097732.1 fused MFS/spermidine synthase [Alphaproteobacteria bacterium]
MILLERRDTSHGTISVYRRMRSGAIIYDQAESRQSEADRTGISLASYVHALFDFLVQANAQNILMIGCGGGTLATMLARVSRTVTVVDVNPEAFDLAQKYFGLPPEVRCHIADGRNFLLACPDRYDAIVLDAFHGDKCPEHLQTPAFMRLVAARLSPGGVLLANMHVLDDSDIAADRLAGSAAAVWAEVRLLDAPGYRCRNAIIAAGNAAKLSRPCVRLRPGEDLDEIEQELNTSIFRPWKNDHEPR